MVYEVCTFQALREALRCKEIWVEGADTFRNPDEDLPAGFEGRRAEHYGALHDGLDPGQVRELACLLSWLTCYAHSHGNRDLERRTREFVLTLLPPA